MWAALPFVAHIKVTVEPETLFSNRKYVGFEVFTSVVLRSIIFWDMTPCSP
jgi:hypothetical protein